MLQMISAENILVGALKGVNSHAFPSDDAAKLVIALIQSCIIHGLEAVPGGFKLQPVHLGQVETDVAAVQGQTWYENLDIRTLIHLPKLRQYFYMSQRHSTVPEALGVRMHLVLLDPSPNVRALLPDAWPPQRSAASQLSSASGLLLQAAAAARESAHVLNVPSRVPQTAAAAAVAIRNALNTPHLPQSTAALTAVAYGAHDAVEMQTPIAADVPYVSLLLPTMPAANES